VDGSGLCYLQVIRYRVSTDNAAYGVTIGDVSIKREGRFLHVWGYLSKSWQGYPHL
jgi:hypothetical protein